MFRPLSADQASCTCSTAAPPLSHFSPRTRPCAVAAPAVSACSPHSQPARHVPVQLRTVRRSALVAAATTAGDFLSDDTLPTPTPPPADDDVKRAMRVAQTSVLDAAAAVLRSFASLLGVIVLGTFGWALLQSSLQKPLSLALERADVLVTAVFGLGGWAFVRFLDNINKRFDLADQRVEKRFDAADKHVGKRFDTADKRVEKRFDAVDKRLAVVESSLQELKTLIQQALPAAR